MNKDNNRNEKATCRIAGLVKNNFSQETNCQKCKRICFISSGNEDLYEKYAKVICSYCGLEEKIPEDFKNTLRKHIKFFESISKIPT